MKGTKLKFVHKRKDFIKLNGWAEIVSAATREEKNLLFQPVDKLYEIARDERIILALDERDSLVGSVVLWDIGDEWNEVGTVYVSPEYRGRGVGQEILQQAFVMWNGQKIMSTSKNSLFIHIAVKSGMIAVSSEYDMCKVVPLTCVCGESDGVADPGRCPFRDKECVFLISNATAQGMRCCERMDKIVQSAIKYSQ